jgi:hypothetical protein
LRHKDQWYQAEHPPIISRELWDSVHAILATNGRVRGNATRATVAYLLKGIVFGNDGRALSPWHTTKKNGRRYRYYVPQRDAKEHALKEIAVREGIDNSYVSRMVNLTTLAPDIVAAILDDALPNHVTLFDLAVDPPALWDEQRARLSAR